MHAGDVPGAARDLYAVLGARPSASAAEITAAFRRRARELRPDSRVDAVTAERFVQVKAAYDVLRDPAARARYDRERTPPAPAPAPAVARRAGGIVVLGSGAPAGPAAPLRAGPVRVEPLDDR
ncbi:J domain-containing protein [Streptomyces sp. 7R007]